MTAASITLKEILQRATEALRAKGSPTPRLDAEVLLSNQSGLSRPELYVNLHKTVEEEDLRPFWKLVERRMEGEPVAYITGLKEFWSLSFEVGPAVLIPRPDTEVLVEEALRIAGQFDHDPLDILEIGTGSGAVSIALARELKGARLTATDISPAALKLAKRNAVLNAVADQISFFEGNLFEPVKGKFDILVSNPPYLSAKTFSRLPAGIRSFEPKQALLAGPEGTEVHDALILGGSQHLRDGGWLLVEMGEGQWECIERSLIINGSYERIGFVADYAGYPRVAKARKRA
jgi:release factor glutamine methyltransferase